MTTFSLYLDVLLFLGLVFGLGLSSTATLRGFRADERLLLGSLGGITGVYLAAWLIYLTELPAEFFRVLPLAAATAVFFRFRAVGRLLCDANARSLLGWLLVFTSWNLGWLSLVRSYGGGEWSADWLEHYQRAIFFLDHAPLDQLFNGIYGLPARPPLANLVVGAHLALGSAEFSHFQIFSTLFSSLVLLPTVLLARHFAAGRAINAVVTAALMFSPFVVQNATFPWTKLPCAFLVLTAVVFYLQGLDEPAPTRRHVAFAAMAGAILTHYSAVPYAVALGGFHLVYVFRTRRGRAASSELATQAALVGLVLGSWFCWAMLHYGVADTFLSNSTATADAGHSGSSRLMLRARVLLVTLVPHPLRPSDYLPITQQSQLGFLRDYLFTIYQTTLPGAVGLGGLIWLAARLRLEGLRTGWPQPGRFWAVFLGVTFVLGIATISWPDRWGVAHINFCALVLIGQAWLGAIWPRLSGGWRTGWLIAITVDVVLGIGLQFYLQANAVLAPGDLEALLRHESLTFSPVATANLALKQLTGLHFVGDDGAAALLIAVALGLIAILVLRRAFAEAKARS